MMRGRALAWRVIVGGACVLLSVAALAAAFAWPAIFDAALSNEMVLSPSSRLFRDWRGPSMPLHFDIFLFNWTNPEEFPDVVPNLVQLGPYRFLEHREHVNITWHNQNNTIAYRTLTRFFFDAETSNGSLDDEITTINAIAASAVYRSRNWVSFSQNLLSMGLQLYGQAISVTKPARELLFEGYEDPLLDMAKNLPASVTGGAPPVDRFGWFYGRNNSIESDGYMEVTTGAARGTIPGQILRWNYEDHISYYEGKCSELAGSAGAFMPRNLTDKTELTMFLPDLCRTVRMDYQRSGIYNDLNYNKYAITARSFDNSTLSPSNTCFCNGECLWSGVMNVSACRFGSPAFISLPHFLHGDPQLRQKVTGMDPDRGKHDFYFSVEPNVGVPIDVSARFQLNFLLEPSPNFALYKDVPRMLFPVFWVQQKVLLEDEKVLSELRAVISIHDWGGTVCACAAVAFAALAVAMATCCVGKPKYIPPLDLNYDKSKEEKTKEEEIKLNPK
ncbi:hypothetical protein O0L34_g11650 [Tuta absoluta]|nr:hypothetical protein O0L34_g11650 [Tuta absoluta]